jgi:polar amino acid transport system substrate-binding protein
MDWSKVLESLRNGDIDGCAAMWRSAEREQYLLFSEPYLENRLVLVGRKGTSVNIASLDGLRGKRVALVMDYAYGKELEKVKEEMAIVYGASDAENLEAVLSGKAEFMLADEILVHWLFDRYPQEAKQLLVAGTKPLLTKPLHFAIRKDYPGAAEVIADFNLHIDHMRKDGTYNALLGLSWILTDVNGDDVDDYVASVRNKVIGHKDPTKDQTGYRLTNVKEPSSIINPDSLFVIDGSAYQDWDDASHLFQDRAVKGQDSSLPEDPAGLVLFKFRF